MASPDLSIPAYAPTALDEIEAHVQTLHKSFRSTKTKDIDFRVHQLRKLYWAISDNKDLLLEALRRDLGKSAYEATISEVGWCLQECLLQCEHIRTWAQDEKMPGTPLQFAPMSLRMRNEPLGTILIIGPFNFPVQLMLAPLIGAIAAGNTVVIKPSELAPHSAMVLHKLLAEAIDPECYVCVNGGIDVSRHLLDLKFDKVVFTGGKKTGALVAQKCAQTLTPVLLELGGQNPAFVSRHADLKLAARRLLWQKCLGAGQLCLSHNYALVERGVVDDFVEALRESYRTFMPEGARASPDFGRIINAQHLDRLRTMLEGSKGKIVLGGSTDESNLFMEPTVVLVDDIQDSMMVDETFGPIWSIMPYDSLDEAIEIANTVDPTPLGLYVFGSEEEFEKVLNHVTSGGATFNDGFFHAITNATPLGGVGSSGNGNYHGYYSFKVFSHQRAVARVPAWTDKLLRMRYMPYSWKELSRHEAMMNKKPNFDRQGNVIKGLSYWLSLVATLGAKRASGGVARWAILLLISMALKLKGDSAGL